MKNRFAGPCRECGETVPVGAGVYEKGQGGAKGANLHSRCATRARLSSEESSILSPSQRLALMERKS